MALFTVVMFTLIFVIALIVISSIAEDRKNNIKKQCEELEKIYIIITPAFNDKFRSLSRLYNLNIPFESFLKDRQIDYQACDSYYKVKLLRGYYYETEYTMGSILKIPKSKYDEDVIYKAWNMWLSNRKTERKNYIEKEAKKLVEDN